MKRLTLPFALIGALFSASTALAAPPIVAKVIGTGTYGDGRLFVMLDKTIQEPGCAQNRFDVPAGHPSIKTWAAIAVAANVSGKNVTLATTGCWANVPTMSTLWDAYFFISN